MSSKSSKHAMVKASHDQKLEYKTGGVENMLSSVFSDKSTLLSTSLIGLASGLLYGGIKNIARKRHYVVELPYPQENFHVCPKLAEDFQDLAPIRHLNETAYKEAFYTADEMLLVLKEVEKNSTPGDKTLVAGYIDVIVTQLDLLAHEARDSKEEMKIAQKGIKNIERTLQTLWKSYLPSLKNISLLK